MDRSGALPDRCVICNADARGYRVSRKLYWSPVLWRLGATATPFVVIGLGFAMQSRALVLLFWPLVIVLMIAHTFVRKKLEIEFGLCARHRRLRTIFGVMSIVCGAGVLGSALLVGNFDRFGMAVLLILVAAVALLAAAQSQIGLQAISISKLTEEHAWLARTGKTFRNALPELPS